LVAWEGTEGKGRDGKGRRLTFPLSYKIRTMGYGAGYPIDAQGLGRLGKKKGGKMGHFWEGGGGERNLVIGGKGGQHEDHQLVEKNPGTEGRSMGVRHREGYLQRERVSYIEKRR